MLNVLTANIDDIEFVAMMERDTFSDSMSENTLISSLDSDLFLVLKDSDAICGYFLGHCLLDEMEIYRIAVSPDKRRCGYGKMLLNEAMHRATSQGVKQCFLEVRESNTAAKKFYGSLGFEEIDRRRRFYRMPDEDAIVMRVRWE